MRNIGMAVLAGGLLVGVAGVATAQKMASAVPAAEKGISSCSPTAAAALSPTAAATVRTAASEASACPADHSDRPAGEYRAGEG